MTESTVGPMPSTTMFDGDTALLAVLPREDDRVNAGNVRVALFPAVSVIEPPPAFSEVVAA